jgi:type IV secretion system protein VirB10
MSDLPPGERLVSPVGGQRRFLKSKKARNTLIALVAMGAMGFIAAGINAAINDKSTTEKPIDTGSSSIAQVTPPPPIPPLVEPKPAEPPATKIVYMPVPAAQPPPQTSLVMPPVNFVQFPAGLGGEGFFDVPAAVPRKDEAPRVEDSAHAGVPATDPATPKTEVAFKPSTVLGGKAGPAIRLTYVMMPQLIPCALDTAMDSTLAGAISCHTTQDVLSPDHVLLMPAGTVVMGTYKNDIKTGQNRLYAFSGNAITKEGIPVPLDSSVADSLGRAGIGPPNAEVDHHYFERFGAAVLLSAVDAGVSLGQAELSRGSTTNLNFGSTGGGSGISSLGQQILQSQINIPPTISVPPGAIVSIVVDHPVDFSDAIKVAAR